MPMQNFGGTKKSTMENSKKAYSVNAGSLQRSLEIHWSYFDLNPFKRVVMPLPMVPYHAITMGPRASWVISAIQIGVVACFVPPRSVKLTGTVFRVVVIISVLGGKWHPAVYGQGIISSS